MLNRSYLVDSLILFVFSPVAIEIKRNLCKGILTARQETAALLHHTKNISRPKKIENSTLVLKLKILVVEPVIFHV